MTFLQHLLYFAIAIPTVVMLFTIFSCTKVNRVITQVHGGITEILMADKQFVVQLRHQINQASSSADVESLANYLARYFAENISSKYPILERYMDVNHMLEKSGVTKQLSGILQGMNSADSEKTRQLVQTAVEGFTKSIQSKIKWVRRMALIVVILLQAVAFGTIFYRAGKYRSFARSNYLYE